MSLLPGSTASPDVQSLATSSDVTALSVCTLQGAASSNAPAAAAPPAATTLLLAGVGSQLHAYLLPSGARCCCTTVLPHAARVHGIRWLQDGTVAGSAAGDSAGSRPAALLAVHGGRHAALLRLLGPPRGSSGAEGRWEAQQLARLPRFQHWSMDAELSWDQSAPSGRRLLLAVGLSDNSVQAFGIDLEGSHGSSGSEAASSNSVGSTGVSGWELRQPAVSVRRVLTADCADRCLLYSLSLLRRQAAEEPPARGQQGLAGLAAGSADGSMPRSSGEASGSNGSENRSSRGGGGTYWLVAGGTIFLDVVVWATPVAGAACTAAGGQHSAANGSGSGGGGGGSEPGLALLAAGQAPPPAWPVLLRLKGHEGSIHRVRWSPCGRLLASASDDRSLRLWQVPPCLPATRPSPADPSAGGRAGGGGDAQPGAAKLQPLHVLWGHKARLWDCCFGGGAWDFGAAAGAEADGAAEGGNSPGGASGRGSMHSAFLATASEDCTCRLWCLSTGQLLSVVPGHRGRGIWNCALLERSALMPPLLQQQQHGQAHIGEQQAAAPAAAASPACASTAAAAGCLLFTSGADGSIKCWRLSDWLPPAAPGAASSLPAAVPALAAPGGAQQEASGTAPAPAQGPAAAECVMLRGLPPDPAAACQGVSWSFGCEHTPASPLQAGQQQQQQQGGEQGQAAAGEAGGQESSRDSKAEWVRCLALAGLPVHCQAGADGQDKGITRQRWLYVATNRGLLHRVHLPDSSERREERWVCLFKPAAPRPILSLSLLPADGCGRAASSGDNAPGGAASSKCGGGSGVWAAFSDLAGTATILLDRQETSAASAPSSAVLPNGSSGGPAVCCSWQPYASRAGQNRVGMWWGAPGGSGSAGLGSRWCFTSDQRGILTAWKLPVMAADSSEQQQQLDSHQQREQWDAPGSAPFRVAEAQLPFGAPVTAVAASLLLPAGPCQPGGRQQQQAAVVAAGDTHGGVAVLLLLLPASQPVPEPASGQAQGRFLMLAAAKRVCELTPVRMLRLAPLSPATAAAGGDAAKATGVDLAGQLSQLQVLGAGGDGILRTLRLPAAAVEAAVSAAARSTAGLPNAANGRAEQEPAGISVVQQQEQQEGEQQQEQQASQPHRLLGVKVQHLDSVTTIDGVCWPGDHSTGSTGGVPGGASWAAGPTLVYGHFSTHFAVWDEAAEAEVAQVATGGWRRPSAADVAGPDDLALCFVRDERLWLYRRRPDALAPPCCLCPPLHGKQQECVRLLELPGWGLPADSSGFSSPAAIGCITGGDDSCLVQQLLPLPAASPPGGDASSCAAAGSAGGAFACSARLAEHPQGAAVKGMALLPLPSAAPGGAGSSGAAAAAAGDGQEWLLVSAGARQVLMACRLRRQHQRQQQRSTTSEGNSAAEDVSGSPERPPPGLLPLLCEEVAVKEPALQARKPKTRGCKLESDQRYLSISAFLWPDGNAGQQPNLSATLTTPAGQLSSTAGLAASTPPPLAPLVFVAAAASDASLALLAADLAVTERQLGSGQRQQQWHAVAALRHHAYPVLSTAHCEVELADGLPALPAAAAAPACNGEATGGGGSGAAAALQQQQQPAIRQQPASQQHQPASRQQQGRSQIVCSGATDGSVAVWDVTPAAAAWAAAARGYVQGPPAPPAGPAGAGGPGQESLSSETAELSPLLVLEGAHQSGVNAVAAVPAGPGRLLVLSGGDDQALTLTLVQLESTSGSSGSTSPGEPASAGAHGSSGAGGIAGSLLAQLSVPTAHSSAVSALWLDRLAALMPASAGGSAAPAEDGEPAGPAAPAGPASTVAFSVGLDQQVRRWRLTLSWVQPGQAAEEQQQAAEEQQQARGQQQQQGQGPQQSGVPAASQAGGSDGSGNQLQARLQAEEAGCVFTQVLEPAALDVLPSGASGPASALATGSETGGTVQAATAAGSSGGSEGRLYRFAVAGRGTELLAWRVPGAG